MALQVWLPLIKDLTNYGLANVTVTSNAVTQSTTEGKLGTSYSFNGSTTWIKTTMPSTMKSLKNSSVCMWIKSTASVGAGGGIMHNDTNAYACMCLYTSGWQMATGSAWKYISTGTFANTSVWHHVACIMDDTKIRTYLDGVLVTETTIAAQSVLTNITDKNFIGLGCDFPGGDEYFTGFINDFRIYDHALSKKEIKELSKGLVLHYSLADKYIEDTTNLINVQYKSSGSGGWGGHTSTWTEYDSTNDPIPCNKCTKMAITYSGSGNGGVGMSVKGISSSSSTTYCYSCYVKTPDALGPLNANILYRYEYDSNNTKTIETGCWTSSNYQALGNNWYRVWGTFTTTANTVRFDVYSFVYPNKTCDYYIGCWQLEVKDHMTPYVLGSRSDNQVYDSSGFMNNGAKSGTVIVKNNTPRNSASTVFDGTSSGIEIVSNIFPIVLNASFTVSMWVYDQETGGRSIFFGNYSLTGSFFNIEKEGNNKARFYWNANPDFHCSNSPIASNAWTHLVMTRDGNTVKCYINGVLTDTSTATLTGTIPSNATVFRLGRDGRSDATMFKGQMSDFRLYTTVLSDADIKELYNQPISFNKHSVMTQGEFIEK